MTKKYMRPRYSDIVIRDREIEALRQRVRELEGYEAAWIETAKHRDRAERELAEFKRSQQVAPEQGQSNRYCPVGGNCSDASDCDGSCAPYIGRGQQSEPVGRYVGLDTIEWLVDGYPKKLPLNTPLYTTPPVQQGGLVVWMQSDHLDKFRHHTCGSQSMLARCSDHQLQSDYQPLYTAPQVQHGDPVLYQCTKCGGANYGCQCASLSGCTEPLYAVPQTTPDGWQLMDMGWLQATLHVNALRMHPEKSHEELTEAVNRVIAAAPKPDTPQTSYSAGDMAEQGAKAFKEGVASVTT